MAGGSLLVLKLVLVPLLVGGSVLTARRWGPSVGGWLIALPLTSGPVLAFLAIDHGPAFAAEAAVGSLTGLGAIAAYALAYVTLARRGAGPLPSLAAAAGGFAAGAIVLGPVRGLPAPAVFGLVVGCILVAARAIPPSGIAHARVPAPAWDLPVRIVVATTLVVGLTTVAPALGAGWSGLVATYPVYVSVLTAFTHRHNGHVAAADVLAGTLAGLHGTAAFYLVVILAAVPAGPLAAFGGALLAALGIEAVTLRRTIRAGVEPEPA